MKKNDGPLKALMSKKITPYFLILPIELVYRILDNLDELTILLSMRNVCTRLNAITDTYHRYQVMFRWFFSSQILIVLEMRQRICI